MSTGALHGWDRLRHGGLLLDPQRLRDVATYERAPVSDWTERELRKLVAETLDDGASDTTAFVTFVLENLCGFTHETGEWRRGSQISSEWGRLAVTGETVKPRHLWRGRNGGLLPVFLDRERRLGVGRGKKATSQVLQWLRAGSEQLALVTNGRQWRLVFAGLDFDAWCEWDVDLWLEEGELSPQVAALRTLFQPALWAPEEKGSAAPLLQAILDSRKGQAELSQVLGERVREAVEILLQGHGEALKERCADVAPAEVYRAAVRMVMRMVVILFAESRELLPRDNALYHGAYGLGGLLEELERVAARSGGRLAGSWSAWPRVLALFRLVYEGSHHQALPVRAYGGELFARGEPDSREGLSRALAVFETACFDRELLSDREVHRMLERITRTRVRVRQGRSSTMVPIPVDFSDLSSEYIGILYEGLLDFELKTAPAGDPVIFLAVGNQPALPLSRLEAMDDKALANLLDKMKDTSKPADDEEEGEDEEAEASAEEEGEEEREEIDESSDEAEDEEEAEDDVENDDSVADERHTTRTRAEVWARHAAEVGKLVRKPKSKLTREKELAHGEALSKKARALVTRVVLPGESYLVRWGGTRKGSGTFYTRPGLAVPTVQRTLRPLAWVPPAKEDGSPDDEAPPAKWTPKKPEEILALKVVDPACGSGTFPVAALRFLTESLYVSLHHHGRITEDSDRSLVALLSSSPSEGEERKEPKLSAELLPSRGGEPEFEPRLKAILRRHVVERCIYGVDLDPLAVELCRLALWIETMDRSLPFSFLDHKVKCGNSLVGVWFDQFQHYPAMAWKNREGGDKSHSNGVHFEKDARTKAIKEFVKERLTSDLSDAISGQYRLGEAPFGDPTAVHNQALAVLSRLHDLPVSDAAERARIYRDELLGSEAYQSLKAAMDLWCACWFWPADELSDAPLPTKFTNPADETRAVAERLAAEKRFFHWELEFPDVFREPSSGFDAVLGNPPWETLQPNSKEYFSNIDPLYRSYGKQEALRYQTAFFESEDTERIWLDYNAGFADYSNWMKYVASPFGDPDEAEKPPDRFSIARGNANAQLHARWRAARSESRGYAIPSHPFRHRGEGKAYTYKLFLEEAHAVLADGGRMGFIVPSGLYSDYGTGALRELFLDHCRWEWLFGFENRDGIFAIHRSFKFNPIIIEKGGITSAIRTAFMRRKLEDWEHGEEHATPYARQQVERFSPRSKAILEIQSARDLEILEKIYSNSVLLGDDGPDGWGIKYAQGDFNMTSDSKLFPPRPKWEADGYRPDEYSRWLKGNWHPISELWSELGVNPLREGEHRCAQPPYDRLPIPRADVPEGIILSREADAWVPEGDVSKEALPLYQGIMVQAFLPSARGWISGTGLRAVWDYNDLENLVWNPQYLVGAETAWERMPEPGSLRIGYREVARSTDTRSFIGSVLPPFPCGHKVPVLKMQGHNDDRVVAAAALLNSFCFDWLVRERLGATALAWYVLTESALPHPENAPPLVSLALQLNLFARVFSGAHARRGKPAASRGGLLPAERIRLHVSIDAISAALFGFDCVYIRHILKGCDFPRATLTRGNGQPHQDACGFWRVDKDKDPELRHTVLTLVAFHDLQQKIEECSGDREKGVEAFCNQNDGEGWMLPETLRLADYGLGHDDRAKEPQPVASRLGPRFYDWQLAQSPEESWRERHLHARNLLGEADYKRLLASSKDGAPDGAAGDSQRFPHSGEERDRQRRLFE